MKLSKKHKQYLLIIAVIVGALLITNNSNPFSIDISRRENVKILSTEQIDNTIWVGLNEEGEIASNVQLAINIMGSGARGDELVNMDSIGAFRYNNQNVIDGNRVLRLATFNLDNRVLIQGYEEVCLKDVPSTPESEFIRLGISYPSADCRTEANEYCRNSLGWDSYSEQHDKCVDEFSKSPISSLNVGGTLYDLSDKISGKGLGQSKGEGIILITNDLSGAINNACNNGAFTNECRGIKLVLLSPAGQQAEANIFITQDSSAKITDDPALCESLGKGSICGAETPIDPRIELPNEVIDVTPPQYNENTQEIIKISLFDAFILTIKQLFQSLINIFI